MSFPDEQYRLHHFRRGEPPPGIYSVVTFECDDNEECIARVTSVMKLVIECDCEHWPDDNYWRGRLPEWLMRTFKSYTPLELSKILSDRSCWADLVWTFGSWLDRMRDRDWQWWSLLDKDGKLTVYVTIQGYPCSTKALEHLIVAAGGELLQE